VSSTRSFSVSRLSEALSQFFFAFFERFGLLTDAFSHLLDLHQRNLTFYTGQSVPTCFRFGLLFVLALE
jgi:hypothetical protein